MERIDVLVLLKERIELIMNGPIEFAVGSYFKGWKNFSFHFLPAVRVYFRLDSSFENHLMIEISLFHLYFIVSFLLGPKTDLILTEKGRKQIDNVPENYTDQKDDTKPGT